MIIGKTGAASEAAVDLADSSEAPEHSEGGFAGGAKLAAVLDRLDRVGLEWVYLGIVIVFGLALILLLPPFQSPDEPAHFFRAWGLAQGRIFPPRDFTERLPADVAALRDEFPVGAIGSPDPYPGYSANKVLRLLGEPISSQRVAVVTAIPSQNPTGYLPQAFAVEVARVIGWSPLGAFYLARIFNLLVAAALVFLAIRIAPFGKAMFLIPALFPVTVAEMASTSPDALMIAGAMLFTALVLAYSAKTELARRDLITLFAAAVVLISIKPGYFALAALVFMLPARTFGSRRRYAAWVGGILALVLVIAVILAVSPPTAPAGIAKQVGPVVDGADPMAQLRHVVTHPLGFVNVLANTLGVQGMDLGYWMTGMLGWFTIWVSQLATLTLLGLTLILIGGRDDEPPVGVRRRIVLLSTWAATMASMGLALYMALTPVGYITIYGLQGRYFTPMLPLLLLGIYRVKLRRPSVVLLLIAVALAVVILTTLRAVWFHYY